ncbi:MAG: SGNH/GDSL hydrolase family protein [Chloroflexota bacterium]
MTRLRNLAIGLSLMLASLLLLLLGLEIFLRLTIKNEADLYANLTYSRSRDAEYFQRSFLTLYAEQEDWRRGIYDPYLGWDYNIENGRTRGDQVYSLLPEEDSLRIVAIGDSFVFGAQVNDNETYPFYLESLLDNTEVLNMGVVGYGIDQAVLKYLKYGSTYTPDLVILGTYPHDYVRTGLSFYGFSKPVFEYNDNNDSIELTNTSIPPPQEVFDELKRKLSPPVLYSYAFLENLALRAYWNRIDSGARERYFKEMDRIVEHILAELVESTQITNTKLLIVQVPSGSSFVNEETLSAAKRDDTQIHLLNIYAKLGIPYVDLLEGFTVGYSREEVFNDLYIYKTDSTRGHFTPEGNLEVARIIKSKLEELR